MVQKIWLHIGTPKSGTTALQHACNDNRALLLSTGLKYVTAPNQSSLNKLAIAINRQRSGELNRISSHISSQLEDPDAKNVLMSSEMLYGMPVAKVFAAIPALRNSELKVLAYIRRQDLYIESKYFQKLKNGRFRGTIWEYISKFNGSGSDYFEGLQPWLEVDCELHVRICEQKSLVKGSTVADAFSLMGYGELSDRIDFPEARNTSPSLGRIQLLHALADAGHPNIRRFQRSLPPDQKSKAVAFTRKERVAFLKRFDASNENLRKSLFPERSSLFTTDDIEQIQSDDLSNCYSSAQISELTAFFRQLLEGNR